MLALKHHFNGSVDVMGIGRKKNRWCVWSDSLPSVCVYFCDHLLLQTSKPAMRAAVFLFCSAFENYALSNSKSLRQIGGAHSINCKSRRVRSVTVCVMYACALTHLHNIHTLARLALVHAYTNRAITQTPGRNGCLPILLQVLFCPFPASLSLHLRACVFCGDLFWPQNSERTSQAECSAVQPQATATHLSTLGEFPCALITCVLALWQFHGGEYWTQHSSQQQTSRSKRRTKKRVHKQYLYTSKCVHVLILCTRQAQTEFYVRRAKPLNFHARWSHQTDNTTQTTERHRTELQSFHLIGLFAEREMEIEEGLLLAKSCSWNCNLNIFVYV